MSKAMKPSPGEVSIAEIQEFAAFSAGAQRYIRRSLDIALRRHDAAERWSRNLIEENSIKAQIIVYERLDSVRSYAPDRSGLNVLEIFLVPLITLSAFDLAQGRISDFAAYKFLYERLVGAKARPWLSSAYCAAASLPHLPPDRRRHLLKSAVNDASAANWSAQEPSFYPQWIDKVDETRPAN